MFSSKIFKVLGFTLKSMNYFELITLYDVRYIYQSSFSYI